MRAPGMTGLAQSLGCLELPVEERLRLEDIYVTNWSPWFDVRLIGSALLRSLRRTNSPLR